MKKSRVFYSPGILLIFLLYLSLGLGPGTKQGEPLFITTPDKFKIGATLYLPGNLKPPYAVVVLIHMLRGSQADWADAVKRLNMEGIAAITIDLRGHGVSTTREGKTVLQKDLSAQDYLAMPSDVELVLKEVEKNKNLDLNHLILIGASIGANSALIYASRDSRVKGVVLLSPGLDYHGVQTSEAAENYKGRPALILSSIGDTYSYNSSSALSRKIGPSSSLKTYKGSEHGTRLFLTNPLLLEEIVQWVKDKLIEKPKGFPKPPGG